MAFVIFGAELYQFHSAMITMRTLFLMLLGAFEYEEMAEVHPFMAPAVRLIVCLAPLCFLLFTLAAFGPSRMIAVGYVFAVVAAACHTRQS